MQTESQSATSGDFRYLKPEVESSLYRNGKVLTRRDPDGSDAGTTGVDLDTYRKQVFDGRQSANHCTLHNNGFERLDHGLGRDIDFLDHEQVVRDYYPTCTEAIAGVTGARVFAFDHNIRSAGGKSDKQRIAGGQLVQGPAHVVHGDYTLFSAPQRLKELAEPPKGNDTLRSILADGESLLDPDAVDYVLNGGRYAIINLWRNIKPEPVQTHPLALCDARSVTPGELVVFEIHYSSRVGENYFAKAADGHRWIYYPELTRDEALLIKQWDSAGGMAVSGGARGDHASPELPSTFSFHSAFDDPATLDDADDRWSIEVRCVALYI